VATVYYCGYDSSGTLGSDAADGLSFANRKATLTAGMALCTTAGDVLRISSNSTYPLVLTAQCNIQAAGTSQAPIVLAGASLTDGSIDGTVAWINGNSAVAYCITDNNANRANTILKNLYLYGATSHGCYIQAATSVGFMADGCSFVSNGGSGLYCNNITKSLARNCTSRNNTSYGIFGLGTVVACTVYSNGDVGIHFTGTTAYRSAVGCTVYSNSSHGIYISNATTASPSIFAYNTCNGNVGSGLRLGDAGMQWQIQIFRNIFSNNGAYGLTADTPGLINVNQCHFYNNTSGTHNLTQIPYITDVSTSGDPKFNNAGSGDFRLLQGSPAWTDTCYKGSVPPYQYRITYNRGLI